MDIYTVILNKNAKNDLKRVPFYIANKLGLWIEGVCHDGLSEMRKIKGYHDEPLQGNRKGQHSIRLNKAYRAIYEIRKDNINELIEIVEVNKHDY